MGTLDFAPKDVCGQFNVALAKEAGHIQVFGFA
jgi:hypothetical protein